MIAKAFDNQVPERTVTLNHQTLRERNPDIVHHQMPTSEVSKIERRDALQGIGMLS